MCCQGQKAFQRAPQPRALSMNTRGLTVTGSLIRQLRVWLEEQEAGPKGAYLWLVRGRGGLAPWTRLPSPPRAGHLTDQLSSKPEGDLGSFAVWAQLSSSCYHMTVSPGVRTWAAIRPNVEQQGHSELREVTAQSGRSIERSWRTRFPNQLARHSRLGFAPGVGLGVGPRNVRPWQSTASPPGSVLEHRGGCPSPLPSGFSAAAGAP